MRFRHGSQEAFCRIYERYRDDLLRLAVSLLKDKSAAEDIVHEVFAGLIEARHTFRLTGRLVATVIVLVLIGAGIVRFGSHSGGLALGDIVASTQRVPWVHVTGTVQSHQKNGHVEQWESFDQRIIVWMEPDGVITYRDAGAEREYVYHPETNTITIIPATDRYDAAGPGSPVAGIQEMIARQKEAGAQVACDATTYNGVPARRIHIIAREEDITLICARDSGLPLSMESIATLPETSEQAVASATFEYPAEGPADIYALGAPPDAKVIDNRPQGSAADLVEQVQRRFDAGFEDHIAVMFESRVDSNDALKPTQIVVMWQRGTQKRMGRYLAYNSAGRKPETATLYPAIQDTWPHLTIADVLGLIGEKFAEFQLIFDGTTLRARVASYWFDPAKDCLLIEVSSRSEYGQSVTTAMEIGRTPAGRWYPTKIRIASSYPGPDGKTHHHTRERRIRLDTSPVFEPGTFNAAALRSDQSKAP